MFAATLARRCPISAERPAGVASVAAYPAAKPLLADVGPLTLPLCFVFVGRRTLPNPGDLDQLRATLPQRLSRSRHAGAGK
jgi:hypothetical protein